MLSSLYAIAKLGISSLETAGRYNLATVQSMLLITLYEASHGIYPAAAISMASCARAARNLGFQRVSIEQPNMGRWSTKEQRITLLAIHNLDR